jgi:DNA-binding transcriptional LysR family regulator
MEIQQLLGFIAVAQSSSFSKAAQRTLRTQPAVSLQIRALEEEFKTRLFDRLGPHKVTLTDDGKLFYDLVEPIVRDIRLIDERFKEARNTLDNFNVSVASHNSAMMYLLPQVVKTFRVKYQNAKLTIVNRSREDILSMVRNDEAQIGITSITKPQAWADYKILGKFRRVLICRKDHALKNIKKITLEEISKYPLILPQVGSNTRMAIDGVFSEKGLSYQLALEVRGREAVKEFVEMGLGVSILSEYYLSRENRRNLIVKDVSTHFGFSETGLLVRKGRYLNHAARSFMALVFKEMRKNQNVAELGG